MTDILPGWTLTGAAHTGASHSAHNIAGQDTALYRSHLTPDGRHAFIIGAIADGAGSSPHAAAASRLAAQTAIASAAASADILPRPANVAVQRALDGAFQDAHRRLAATAQQAGAPLSDYHTTLLMFIHSGDALGAAQVGDGAIVASTDARQWRNLTTPQQGRYANETHFITDPDFDKHYQNAIHQDDRWCSVAMFSDGMQRLLLDYADPEQPVPHQPFFQKTFASLAKSPSEYDSYRSIYKLLKNVANSRRSHDDLSLIIANRPVVPT